jgi:putative redox protein
MVAKPLAAELVWTKELVFGATSGTNAFLVDGNSAAGPSPVQLLVISLASCMSIDVVDMLRKGRHPLTAFRVSLTGERAPDSPRRLLQVALRFHVHGAVPGGAVQRAIELSRDRYCSVWHSMRADIGLTFDYELVP